jgi:hypothetical protein
MKEMRWAGHVAWMREMRSGCKILARKPERKRSIGRPRRRWEDNIRMDLRETWWKVLGWRHLNQNGGQ